MNSNFNLKEIARVRIIEEIIKNTVKKYRTLGNVLIVDIETS